MRNPSRYEMIDTLVSATVGKLAVAQDTKRRFSSINFGISRRTLEFRSRQEIVGSRMIDDGFRCKTPIENKENC